MHCIWKALFESGLEARGGGIFWHSEKGVWGKCLRITLYYALIVSVAMYAEKTWRFKEEDFRKLSVFENDYLGTMMKVSYINPIKMDDI